MCTKAIVEVVNFGEGAQGIYINNIELLHAVSVASQIEREEYVKEY